MLFSQIIVTFLFDFYVTILQQAHLDYQLSIIQCLILSINHLQVELDCHHLLNLLFLHHSTFVINHRLLAFGLQEFFRLLVQFLLVFDL